MIRGKKADEKLLSVWLFIILALIGISIIIGVSLFYSVKIDTRQIESEILSSRILDCLVKQGKIVDEAMQDNFDIFEKCSLKKDLFENREKELFYFNVSFYKDSWNNFEKSFSAGSPDLYFQCIISEDAEAEHFSECSIKRVISTYKGEVFFIDIIAASNQIGRSL